MAEPTTSIDLTPVDYLDMVLRKTCAYTTILPLRVGALIGSWGARRPRRRSRSSASRSAPRSRSRTTCSTS